MPIRGDSHLNFSADRFESYIVDLVILAQVGLGSLAVLAFLFWFLIAPSDDGYWYLELLLLSISSGVVAYLITYLYRRE